MWDVWFDSQIVCSKIEHLSNIDEMYGNSNSTLKRFWSRCVVWPALCMYCYKTKDTTKRQHQHSPRYGNTGCRVFKRGIQNKKYFYLRINTSKGNYWILRIGLSGGVKKCQILTLFDSLLLIQNSKLNNFLWVCSFLGKDL